MGAVKTNRRGIRVIEKTEGGADSLIDWEKVEKDYKEFIRYFDGANNRRKMAGLRMIRRAKS